MKIQHTAGQWIILVLTAFLLGGCDKDTGDNNLSPNEPLLDLTASTDEIILSEETPDEEAVTFTWTAAADVGEGFNISYLFKMDVAGREFQTTIPTENLGGDVFSKSYTHSELQALLSETWSQPYGVETSLEARVIAQVEGPRFVKPEVVTIATSATPYTPTVIEAAKVYMAGQSVDGSPIEMEQTIESPYIYAFKGVLKAGTINFPITGGTNGATVLSSQDVDQPIEDGNPMALRVHSDDDPEHSWLIPADGSYRVVLNLEKRTLAIYSEANDLQGIEEAVYMHGPATSSNWTIENAEEMVQSVANPNIWIYYNPDRPLKTGEGLIKFIIERVNGGFAYSANTSATNIIKGTYMQVYGGRDYRNSYYKVIDAGMNLIILDIERMTVLFDQR